MFIPIHKLENRSKIKVTRDKPIKSVVKSITWRIVGTADTIAISYFMTGKFTLALSIGGIEVFTKMILYYLHERAWTRLHWGRMMVVIRKNTRRSRISFERIILNRA